MLQQGVLQVVEIWGVFCFFVSRTGLPEKAHCTSELQHSTKFLPCVLQHFYSGAKVLQEKSGKADLECTFYLCKKKKNPTRQHP